MRLTFTEQAHQGHARAGRVELPRGGFDTPIFMPVGTLATVKSLTPGDLRGLGADMILNNAYHLMLRPGDEQVARLGGLHRFQGWNGGILTDSGGYQVYSLPSWRRVSDR